MKYYALSMVASMQQPSIAWLQSPKGALHAGSYCKPVAHTVVELWQLKIGNIIRITENRPTSMPHSSKTKGDVTPTNGMAYNLQAFFFDLVQVACS